jgi:hypothetical protein
MAKKREAAQSIKPKSSRRTPAKVKASFQLTSVNGEEKRELVGKAAYYRAERRGFVPGFELDDWLAAEREIEGLFHEVPMDPVSTEGAHIKKTG